MAKTVRSKYVSLLKDCKDKGVKVKLVKPSVLKDFAGMNHYAAKTFGYKNVPKDTILIDRSSSVKRKIKDITHERVEINRMKKGDKYWVAHCKALRAEKKV
jgi:hypothetical protein